MGSIEITQPLLMPAEWEAHQTTWIAWPASDMDWPGKGATVDWIYAEIARALIGAGEQVSILVATPALGERARECLIKNHVSESSVAFYVVPYDRTWLRDSLPTAVRAPDGSIVWIAWRFNGWAKYENYLADSEVPARVSELSGIPLVHAERPDSGLPLVLEGGAIETDGQGTLIVTEECLLSPDQCRNPGLSRERYEQAFAKYLGIKKTIWLGSGCVGDDTHGHIDDIARFAAPGRVLLAVEEDRTDANYESSQDNLRRLMAANDSAGRTLEVIPLPFPRPVWFEGMRLPASYANFYIANKAVLVPVFNDSNDVKALKIIEQAFPGREVLPVFARDLIWGLGTLHCLTQQQP